MIIELVAFIAGSACASRAGCGAPPQFLLKWQRSPEKFAIARAPALRAISLGTIVCTSILVACESSNYLPPVTPQMAAATNQPNPGIELATLSEGRTLFARRCIECHTLPPLWHYTAEEWPRIVRSMADRAGLNSSERDAIIAYIRAVRSQPR
jgi:hypothetical protein